METWMSQNLSRGSDTLVIIRWPKAGRSEAEGRRTHSAIFAAFQFALWCEFSTKLPTQTTGIYKGLFKGIPYRFRGVVIMRA